MKKALLLITGLFSAFVLFAQRTITGKVTDRNGSPISNASVIVKETGAGVSATESGNYSISVDSRARTLVFSFIDKTAVEVSIGSQAVINVTLQDVSKSLDEVVVVAYGTQKRAELTGSVATVKSADLENRPFTSVDKALQGQVAGLQSVAGSGAPGSNQNIRIRGISSITASSAPLWVIDGVPVNTGDASRITTTSNLLSTLNPNDIESISVLKDAASQSIYGSRAANGVIVVTTKSGRSGRTRFKFDAEVGQSDMAYKNDRYRPLNAKEFFDLTREGLLNANLAGITPATVDAVMTANFGFGNGVDFDWIDATTQKGSQQQYNLSASGGNDKTTFFVSGGYFKQEGTVIKSNLNRYSGSLRVTNKATDRLSLNVNLSGGTIKQNTPFAGGAFANPVLTGYFLLPSRSAYLPNGDLNYNTPDFPFGVATTFNPVALAHLNKDELRQTSLRGSFSAEYKIMKDLNFKSTYGADFNVLEEDLYWNPSYGDGYSVDPASAGRAYAYYTRYYNYVWTNLLNYTRRITKNEDLVLNLQLGYESQKSKGYFTSLQAQGFPARLELVYAASGSKPQTASSTLSEYAFLSQFSSGSFNYKNRYIVSGSFRRDGSSRFGPNNRYGNFWSVGGTWNIDNESFMQSVGFINQLKLRASYGVNGNAGVGNYDWFPSYTFASPYNNAPGSAPGIVGNENLTWELNKPFNIGLDVSILKGRLNFTTEYYIRKSEDLLLAVQLSRTSGFTTATRNVGAMENKGVEVTVNAIPVRTKDFTWTIDVNFAHNKNKITSLPNGSDITAGAFVRRVGQDFQSFNLREYAGVDPANGDPLWYVDRSKNLNTTNNITAAVRVINGSASPKFFGGVTNSFTFKGFRLEALFYYNFGNLLQDSWSGYLVGSGNGGTWNKVARQLERWQKPGDVTTIPKYIYNGNKNFHDGSSDFFLNDGGFIRLRNIELGYELPASIMSRLKISSVNFYVRGTNIWTWVKDKNLGFDPEQSVTSQTNLDVFIPKTVSVGMNIGF